MRADREVGGWTYEYNIIYIISVCVCRLEYARRWARERRFSCRRCRRRRVLRRVFLAHGTLSQKYTQSVCVCVCMHIYSARIYLISGAHTRTHIRRVLEPGNYVVDRRTLAFDFRSAAKKMHMYSISICP